MRIYRSAAAIAALALVGTGVAVLGAPTALANVPGGTVSVYESNPNTNTWLAAQPSINFSASTGSATPSIVVDPSRTYQTMSGFGGSLTDTSAANLNALSSATRARLMQDLFSPSTGIGMSYLRQPLGVNDTDLTRGAFSSLDDTASDESTTNLPHFSLASDEAEVIPLIKNAMTLNPSLKIMGSSWSPPAWMKTTNTLLGQDASGNKSTLDSGDSALFAAYLVKAVKGYAADGVPLDAMTIQNEPNGSPKTYPGMVMTAAQESDLIANYVGPAFASNSLSTKILDYDHDWSSSYPGVVLSNAAAAQYVSGTAFHQYGGTVDAQSTVKRAFPTKDIYFTEGANNPATTFSFMMKTQMINTVRNWSKTVIFWNLVANSSNGPSACSGCQPFIVANPTTDSYTYNPDYYAMGQVSKFVQPGAVRIASNDLVSNAIDNVAFTNPDGSTALVTYNESSSAQSFQVKFGSDSFTYSLPAGAAATFKWAGTAGVRTVNPFGTIEAETASATTGTDTQPTTDGSGTEYLGFSSSGSRADFANVDLQNGATSVSIRAANGATTATSAAIRLDSPTSTPIATVPIPATGGWQTYSSSTATFPAVTGLHTLYVTFGGSFNFDSMIFGGGTASGGTLLNDTFEDSNISAWTATGGTWSVCTAATKVLCKTSSDTGVLLTGSTGWRDYTVTSAVVPSATNNAGVSILGRASDASHFYQLELHRTAGGTEQWTLFKNIGGTYTNLGTGSYNITPGATYYLRLVMSGTSLTASIATSPSGPWSVLTSATDSSLTTGQAGVRAASTTGQWDNFVVTQG